MSPASHSYQISIRSPSYSYSRYRSYSSLRRSSSKG